MATESWALDGVSLTSGAFSLMDINVDPPRERQEWISAADSEAAALVRQSLHENRTITMKLRVAPQASMNAALDQVGALVDKLRKASSTQSGVPLVWVAANASRTGTFTALSGEITGVPIALGGDGYSWLLSRPIVTVEMMCHPYGVGTETLTSTASSSTPYVDLEIAGVTGDVPALGRIIITDTATQSRRHVEWGLEGPLTYNASTSLLVDSDSMVTSGFAGAQTTGGGAYDPNASGNNCIQATLFNGQTVAVCGTGNLSHVGTFRVKARIQTSLLQNEVRLSWRAGDGPMNSNPWVSPAANTGWVEVDLGTISVPAATLGSQRWTGQIEAHGGAASPGVVIIDYLTMIPTSNGYGKARASFSYVPGALAAQDSFVGTTAASALSARSAPLGGSWATSGDATDLVFADNFNASTADAIESIVRSTSVSETNGRFAVLGSTSYTDSQVDVRARIGSLAVGVEQSVILRWVDSSNYLRLMVPELGYGNTKLEQVVAGVVTTLAESTWQRAYQTSYRFRLIAYATGRTIAQVISDAGALLTELQASAPALITGGTLQTGKPGLRDRSVSTTGGNRYFTEFAVSTPAPEQVVLYSGRNMQIRHDDVLRQDSAGTYAGRPASYRGSRFLAPVGTSRVFVKVRRNDVEATLDDSVTDATQIQVGWTPRFLVVPRA